MHPIFSNIEIAILIFILSASITSCAQSGQQDHVPAPPPVYSTDENGKTIIMGWEKVESDEGNLYRPSNVTVAVSPGFFQLVAPNNNYNAQGFFEYLASKTPLKITTLKEVVMNSYYLIEGKMLVACFGEGLVNEEKVYFFMDLNGPDINNEIIGTLVYASPQIFDSWNGILFPLVLNGYVKDTSIFENKTVFKIKDFSVAATFYGAMVDTKLYSELSVISTLSEEAMKAMKNATTISNCVLSDNCEIIYDSEGIAKPNYTN